MSRDCVIGNAASDAVSNTEIHEILIFLSLACNRFKRYSTRLIYWLSHRHEVLFRVALGDGRSGKEIVTLAKKKNSRRAVEPHCCPSTWGVPHSCAFCATRKK